MTVFAKIVYAHKKPIFLGDKKYATTIPLQSDQALYIALEPPYLSTIPSHVFLVYIILDMILGLGIAFKYL